MTRRTTTLPGVSVLALWACAHVPAPAPTAAPADRDHGSITLRFIQDLDAPPPDTDHREFHAPKIVGGPIAPIYPPAALAAKAGAVVVVRITIDTEGDVVSVEDSPVMTSSAGPFAAAFRAAVEQALRKWRFSPGWVEDLADGKDLDGDGKADYTIVIRTDRVPFIYDVRFDFTIERGEGRVRSNMP